MSENSEHNNIGGAAEAAGVFSEMVKAKADTIEKIAHYGNETSKAIGRIASGVGNVLGIVSGVSAYVNYGDSAKIPLTPFSSNSAPHRQGEPHQEAWWWLSFGEFDLPIMGAGDFPHDGQAQPTAISACVTAAVKTFKHRLALCHNNAGACVFHDDGHKLCQAAQAHGYHAFTLCVAQCIINEIDDGLTQQSGMAA